MGFELRPLLLFTEPDTRVDREPSIYLRAALKDTDLDPMTTVPAGGRNPNLRGCVAVRGLGATPERPFRSVFYLQISRFSE